MHSKAASPTSPVHRNPESPHLSDLVATDNPAGVLVEIETIVGATAPRCRLEPFKTAFQDIVGLFSGHYPGYRRCNTRYHDLNHTMDTVLAMARIIHGADTHGMVLEPRDIILGLIAALMHDAGYIQRHAETEGTGARFATVHIQRGIAFMRTYMRERGFTTYDYRKCRAAILCTDLSLPIPSITFETRSNERMGKMLAAADLMGQTADRCYLEKLRFLYLEFTEAGIRGYNSELELLQDSLIFNDRMKKRLAQDLDGVDRYLTGHFKSRWNIGRNLYHESINNNLSYLKAFLDKDPEHYGRFLNRRGAP